MTDDIVARLRGFWGDLSNRDILEASDEIERLRAALVPFAAESLFRSPQQEFVCVKLSDCEIARAALAEQEDQP